MVAIHKPAHDVILKPVVSEKSYAASDRGQYTFVVAPDANKVQIKQAIEEIFNVKVTKRQHPQPRWQEAAHSHRFRPARFPEACDRDRRRGPDDRHLR